MDVNIESIQRAIADHLPRAERKRKPYVTVTYAQSLDGRISAGRGIRTKLSGPHSHKMTHYLRSTHAAILVGKGTVCADDPKLNCRFPGVDESPQPILLDTYFSWDLLNQEWAILDNAKQGTGRAPWVMIADSVDLKTETNAKKLKVLEAVGGKVFQLPNLRWPAILDSLESSGIESLMIEGGSAVINSAMSAGIADSVIVTIAPVYLGYKGLDIAPTSRLDLVDVKWWSDATVEDAILCARQGPKEEPIDTEA